MADQIFGQSSEYMSCYSRNQIEKTMNGIGHPIILIILSIRALVKLLFWFIKRKGERPLILVDTPLSIVYHRFTKTKP
jgi:hypothetical protein